MAGVSIDLTGLAGLPRLLDVLRDFPEGVAGPALREEAEIEMTEAKLRTPVKTGALRGSGTVVGPVWDGDSLAVVLAFGVVPSVSTAYAVAVHENVEAFHRNGQAKFLESVVLESAPYLAARVAERIQVGAGQQYQPSQSDIATNARQVAELNDTLGLD